jgi:hypothetical protein
LQLLKPALMTFEPHLGAFEEMTQGVRLKIGKPGDPALRPDDVGWSRKD